MIPPAPEITSRNYYTYYTDILPFYITAMHNRTLRKLLGMGALCVGAATALCGCTDSSYDLDKVDLTMGLGSDGLTLKLGQTETDYLSDMLSTDENVKLDHDNLYYMVNSSEANTTFHVNETDPAKIDNQTIRTRTRIIDYALAGGTNGAAITIPAGRTLTGQAVGVPVEVKVNIDGVESEVKEMHSARISTVRGAEREVKASLTFNIVKSAGVDLQISELSDFTIQLPPYVKKINSVSNEWTIQGNSIHADRVTNPNDVIEVTFDEIDLSKGQLSNGSFEMSGESTIATMSGKVSFRANSTFTMHEGDYADMQTHIDFSTGQNMYVHSITGIFDPEITTSIDPIDVVDDLPDFLDDPDVKISTTNTTIRFQANTRTLPFNVQVSADLTSVKEGDGAFTYTAHLKDGLIAKGLDEATIYYYEGDSPYDPEGIAAGADKRPTQHLGGLFERVPDQINVDMNNRKIRLVQEAATAILGQDYYINGSATAFVPFKFDKGLTIVYKDSTNSFNDDVKDYAAEGIRVSGDAVTTIPLDLTATLTAIGLDGRELPGVKFNEVTITGSTDGRAETSTPLTINATLSDPKELGKINKLRMKIRCKNDRDINDGGHALYSTQYLKFQNLKLRLTGKVIGDFN